MNVKAFLVDALGGALDLGIATPDDVLRHVTPDLLAEYLPRPLWARLLTACLGAPRVDAQLVVETIGVPNLCEHVPSPIIWACIAEVAARALGKSVTASGVITTTAAVAAPVVPAAKPTTGPIRIPLAPPPPEAPPPASRTQTGNLAPIAGPAIPAPIAAASEVVDDVDFVDERPAPRTGRVPAAQRFRQSSTGVAPRPLGGTTRRPQVNAGPATASTSTTPAPAPVATRNPRRISTEVSEAETETSVDEWRGKEIAVDDSQLVDWQAETTTSGDEDFGDLRNKR
jgi:hypothetical protein